ncbi:hypothetical protein ACFX13_045982 [Malus domestica]
MSIIFYFQVAHENWLNPLAPEFCIYSAAVSPCPLAPTPPSAANRYHSLTVTWNFIWSSQTPTPNSTCTTRASRRISSTGTRRRRTN